MGEAVDTMLSLCIFNLMDMQLHFNASHKSIVSPFRIHFPAALMAVAGSHFVTGAGQRGMSFVWANN